MKLRTPSILLLVALLSCGISFAALAVSRVSVRVPVDPTTGRTTEQSNIVNRLTEDNRTGQIAHFYVLSPESGQALIYSTVKGKVTSSGKRLTPRTTIEKYDCGKDCVHYEGQRVVIGGAEYITTEILQDDGTYGNSVPYLYWFDAHGRYHQHFFTEGQVIHISAQPMAQTSVVLNLSR
ncbi:MAG: hypothetical protein SFV17_16860 [Candidatus Obscuribacter sp.]|nr:hypothetical protein [Candidatus Obscuribacter sp.]